MKLPFLARGCGISALLGAKRMPRVLAHVAVFPGLGRYDSSPPAPCRPADVTSAFGCAVSHYVYLRLMTQFVLWC